ncbi:hypothetical protein PHYSODRAFT_474559 [Phytophthora sojae]|uniref:PX domain-containing protein n=1 Tax=Phytophthora sojae (strain P6497) TaxID=1094619 RepID=G4YIY9_PHYSP|nr:hypothetical protein PHYSODRAFT_474559 [Phytophthora sojae]EGZ28811.1 hypothetical protein PHYSODRAFT_474559 [Phytophthora sojae]|eukprot:XP_009516086.1 hypothetical protein PHYSODRAFT_474559 [Phytophthora sojae]
MLAVDALFLFVGVVYGSRVLAPKPMTYLSEIAFPLDFCVKLAASFMLFLLNGLQWLYQEIFCSWLLYHRPFGRDQQNVVVMMETLVWGMSTSILWMEYRRGLTPSVYLRLFWFLEWLDATYFLVVNGTFAGASSPDDDGAMSYMTGMVFGGVCYAASAVLVLFMCVRPTTVTPEFIAYPMEVNTPSAYLNSAHCQPPTSLYGSFKDWELVAYPSSSKSTEERTMLDITIPATVSSIWGNRQFVSFKIVVQTDDDHWTLRRPYSDFVALDEELPEEVRADCPLPPEEYDNRKVISWKERPRSLKSRLEKYLKQVLHHPKLAPYASQALCEFLEMVSLATGEIRAFRSDVCSRVLLSDC